MSLGNSSFGSSAFKLIVEWVGGGLCLRTSREWHHCETGDCLSTLSDNDDALAAAVFVTIAVYNTDSQIDRLVLVKTMQLDLIYGHYCPLFTF